MISFKHLAKVYRTDEVETTALRDINLDVGTGGKSYVVRVSSDVLAVARARSGDAVVVSNCRVVKSGSGFKCPVPVVKK